MMSVAKHIKPYGIIIYGDFVDFYKLSFHSKDPSRKSSIKAELTEAKEHLDELDTLGAKEKKYVMGNHEYRLERYIWEKCPEFDGLIPSVEEYLGLKERGWDVIQYKKYGKQGHFRYTHDVGVAGQFAHYKAAQAFQTSNGTGHTHRAGVHYFGTVEGDSKISVMFGWGGDKEAADYANETQKKDWMLSFGVSYENQADKCHHVQVIPLINYTAVVNGKLFEAPFTKSTVSQPIKTMDQLLEKQRAINRAETKRLATRKKH